MSWEIEVEGGKTVRLPTAGKYCDRDIVVTAMGGGEGENLDEELATQDELIANIMEALANKAGGGTSIETCRVAVINEVLSNPCFLTFTSLDEGRLVTEVMENPFSWIDGYDSEAVILEVVKNTSIIFSDSYPHSFTCDGDPVLVSQGMADDFGFFTYGIPIECDGEVYITEG